MPDLPDNLEPAFARLLLAIADDKLMLGHRNSDWTGLGPILEEDIAFSALAQDEIAHAQALYELAASITRRQQDAAVPVNNGADALAFGRDAEAYRCCALVELPDEYDWATAICRQLLCDHFDLIRLGRLAQSSFKPAADLARRLRAEETLHVEHADDWIGRLGAGTDESRDRVQRALAAIGPRAVTLFEPVDGERDLESAGLYPAPERDPFDLWAEAVTTVTANATLTWSPPRPDPGLRGGRRGRHTPHLAVMLDEMCEVWRLEPGAAW